jgi:hypothetical protein
MIKKLHNLIGTALLLGTLFSVSSCKTNQQQIPWDDITSITATNFHPNPKMFIEDTQLTPNRIKGLSPTLRRNPNLAKLAVSRALDHPYLYEKGVFGRIGSAKLFVAERKNIPDFNRLYWVMVKVLSRKYGCFMIGRVKEDHKITIKCRDKRNIVMWRSMGKSWIQFYARQFDKYGYEIKVKNRRIVRISPKPVFHRL